MLFFNIKLLLAHLILVASSFLLVPLGRLPFQERQSSFALTQQSTLWCPEPSNVELQITLPSHANFELLVAESLLVPSERGIFLRRALLH